MNEWYAIETSKIIKDDYEPDDKKRDITDNDSLNVIERLNNMDRKIFDVLNEFNEIRDFMISSFKDFQTEIRSELDKINSEHIILKNKISIKDLEIERLRNLLIRNKIAFSFSPQASLPFKSNKTVIEKMLGL